MILQQKMVDVLESQTIFCPTLPLKHSMSYPLTTHKIPNCIAHLKSV